MNKEQSYVKIDFFDYNRNCYVSVNSDFRKQILEEARRKIGSWRLLSKELGAASKHVTSNWKIAKTYNKRKMRFQNLAKCCSIAGIPETELIRNINAATKRYPTGDISIKNWQLFFDEKFAEWLGMLKGDGSVGDRHVQFSNTYFDLVFHFSEFLENIFSVNRNRIKMSLTFFNNNSKQEAEKIIRNLKRLGYAKAKLYRGYVHKGKKIVLTCKINFKVLSDFITNVIKVLPRLLANSENSVKAAYVRGFAASEGCVSHVKGGARFVTITQKNRKDIEFIKNLLHQIGIERIEGPRWTGTVYRIATSNREDLERFQKYIGFGAHEQKNQKLKFMIDTYKIKRCYVNGTYRKI